MEANIGHQSAVAIACYSCKGKHQISICDKKADALLTTNNNIFTYLVIIVSVEGVKCRALIDIFYRASDILSKFISLINKKPIRTKTKTIQRLINSSSKKITNLYSTNIR